MIANIPRVLIVGNSSKSTYMLERLHEMEARGEVILMYQSYEGYADVGKVDYTPLEKRVTTWCDECSQFTGEMNFGGLFDWEYGLPKLEKQKKKRAIKPYFRHNERY